jgi:hypothetical protein
MVTIGRKTRARTGAAAAACGAAAAVALVGCSSGGGSVPATSKSAPSWAAALGSGVTVISPGTAPTGNDTPGSVMTDVANGLNQKNISDLCNALPPSDSPKCQSEYKSLSKSQLDSGLGSITNFKIGYIVVKGTQAIAGDTGKECNPDTKKCFSNSDPAAIFSSNKGNFAALWKTVTTATNGTTAYTLTPLTQINGKWYLYANPAS